MTTTTVLKLAKKIYNGCERTSYIKSQAKKADFYLTINALREMELETEENCFSMIADIFGSVINKEV
jgi:hypothetical protein